MIRITRDTKIIIGKVLAVIIVINASIGVGIIIGDQGLKSPLASKGDLEFQSITEVWDLLHTEYINAPDLDDKALITGAIRGMVGALDDPYTEFFDDQETQALSDLLNGSFEGVGIRIDTQGDTLVIIAPLKNSPAQIAGVQPGDVITAVDGQPIEGKNLNVVIASIRGPKGTQVVLTVLRNNQSIDIAITRDVINIPTVEYQELEGNIAHISIFQFLEGSASDFDEAISDAFKAGNDKIILDLRSNPGGFLGSAVSIADRFLPLNSVILVERVKGGEYKTYTAQTPPTIQDIPVVVLQDKGSASASEILVGALQSNNKIPVVGETSFGKGTVQTINELPGNTSIKYTITEWLTPEQEHIDGVGIIPTVEVQNNPDTETDEQLEKAIEVIQGL